MGLSPLILGVDGGGSKTTALLADAAGRVLGRGASGPSNYQSIGAPAAQDALRQAVALAWADAGLPAAPPAALCLGMSGAGRAEDQALFQAWAAAEAPGTRVLICNDAQLVLAAGAPQGWGVAVISGTGSLVYGQDAAGHAGRAGGWGYLLGDEGSGHAIGLEALRSVARASDGRAAPTRLTAAILQQWRLPSAQALIRHVYGGAAARADIAALAPLVDAAAAAGDAAARRILRRAGRELALAVRAVVRSLNLPAPTPCALAGGVLLHSRALQDALLQGARAHRLLLDPVTPVVEPAHGALRLAARLLSGPP